MKKRTIFTVCSLGLLLTGCGSTGSVMKLGPENYMVSASKHYTSGGAVAKTNALEAATSHCVSMGRQLLVKNLDSTFDAPFYTTTVTFTCTTQK